MSVRVVIALAAALVLATGAALWGWSDRGVYKAQAEAAEAKVERLEARVKGIQADVSKAQAQAQAARQSLQEALDAHPDWSNAPVPGPVSDGLCGTLRCD